MLDTNWLCFNQVPVHIGLDNWKDSKGALSEAYTSYSPTTQTQEP